MATLNGLTTNLGGSAGAWTFYNRLGSTVAKQKIDNRHRKRLSDTQLKHSLSWGNIVAFWSVAGGRLKDSFERKRNGQTDFNMFISNNVYGPRIYLPSYMVRAGACVAAPYLVTMGSLPSIEVVESSDGCFLTGIRLGDGFSITPETTVGELSRAIVTNNDGFEHGDDLICLAVHQLVGSSDGYPHVGVSPAVLRLDAYSDVPLSMIPNAVPAFAAVEGCLGSGAPIVGGMTWIHMRQLRSRRVVSTQRLVLSGDSAEPSSTAEAPLYRGYTTPEALAAAIGSYRRRSAR